MRSKPPPHKPQGMRAMPTIPSWFAASATRGKWPDRKEMRKLHDVPFPNTLGSCDLTGLAQSLQNRCSLPAERGAYGRCGIEPSYVPDPYIPYRQNGVKALRRSRIMQLDEPRRLDVASGRMDAGGSRGQETYMRGTRALTAQSKSEVTVPMPRATWLAGCTWSPSTP